MSYRELCPEPALQPQVDRLWLRAATHDRQPPLGPHVILPDGCIDLIVRLAPREGRASVRVVGAMTSAARVPDDPGASLVAVRFRPGGAAALLGVPAHELTDLAVAGAELPALATAELARGCEAALEALDRGDAPRSALAPALAALGTWLRRRAAGAECPDRQIAYAVRRLFAADAPRTEDLARALGWSRQHLRRRLVPVVGLAPKALGRIARLQRAVAHLQRHPTRDLARAALELGYFDQAHLARELRLLAELSATEVRAARGSIFPIHSLLADADYGHVRARHHQAHHQPDRG